MRGGDAPRACVFTCLLGGYERLNEQPVAAASGLDFLCFTDDPALTSTSWRIRPYTPAFPLDPVRSQRMVKLAPHELLPEYDVSLYVDNSVILTAPPEEVLARHLPAEVKAASPGHSFRASVRDEFLEVVALGYDDGGRVMEQLNHYLLTAPEILEEVPFWSGLMLRRHHDPQVIAAMRLWLAHVLRYSRRDQLSVNYAMARAGLAVRRLEIDNRESWFHRWPVTERRDRTAFPFSPVQSLLPPQVLAEEWRRSRRAMEERIEALEQSLAAARSGPSAESAPMPAGAPSQRPAARAKGLAGPLSRLAGKLRPKRPT